MKTSSESSRQSQGDHEFPWALAPVTASQPGGAIPSRGGFGRLVRDSALYAVGSVLGKVVGLALLPFLTRTLSTAEFGRYDVLSTLQSAVTSVLLLGLDVAATRLFVELRAREQRRMFSTWLAMVVALLVPCTLIFFIGRAAISISLFGTDGLATAVALTGLAIIGSALQLVGLTALRNHRRPGAFAAISGGSLLVNGVLIIVLVPVRPTVTTVLAAMATSMCIGAIAALLVAAAHLAGRPDRRTASRLLALGLPLVPAVACTWIAEFANRAILLDRSGAEEVAFFSVAARFASVSLLVVMGFQLAWQPTAFADSKQVGGLSRVASDGRRIMIGVTATAVAIAVISPELVQVASGDTYLAALPPLGFSLVFTIAIAGYHVATMPSAISAHMRDLGISAAVAAAAGVVLCLWWAGVWGGTGTAAAIAVGQVLGTGLAFGLGRRRAPVPYQWSRILTVCTIGIVVALACTLPDGGAPIPVRVGLASAFLVAIEREGSLGELRRGIADQNSRLWHR